MQHLDRHLLVLAAVLCLMAGLSSAGIAAPTHEETLTAWAEQKGWSQFSSYPLLGYRSDEYHSYDISIVHDRTEEWMQRPPYNGDRRSDFSYYAEIREPITVAGGIPAWREYRKYTQFETQTYKGYETENWEYYCHKYLVLVRAQRNTADNHNGADPIGILEEYIAFARGDVSEPVPTPSEEEAVIRIIEVVGEEAVVDIRGDGDLDIAEVGMVLTKNAKIITGLGARIRVDYGKLGIVTIGEMTNFSIGDYLISAAGITADTNMKVGEVNVKVDRKYKEIDFRVSVPTCTVSVRGTEFIISHREDPMETRISVVSGEVEVTPTLFSAPSVTLVAEDQIVVYEDRFGEITELAEDGRDPFAQACASLCASDEDFIRSLYHCITHREPTTQELEAQVGRLESGTLRRDMVQYFFASPGYVAQNHPGVRFITDACQAIYGRQPSDAETSAWPRTDRSFIVVDMLDNPEHLIATQACAVLWRGDAAPRLTLSDILVGGSYRVDTWTSLHHPSTWTLQIADYQITGMSTWTCCPGPRSDPLTGRIDGNTVTLTRDCSGQGHSGPCTQVYTGTLQGNTVEGSFTFNGRHQGTWKLYLDSSDDSSLTMNVDDTKDAGGAQTQSVETGRVSGPDEVPVLGHQQPTPTVAAASHPAQEGRHTISFLGVLGIVGLVVAAAILGLALLQS